MELVSQLSPAAKAKIKALSGPRPGRFLLAVATTWMTIGLAITAAILMQNIIMTLAAIYIVATRQNLLALLVHEQTHYLGLNSRYGDMIANCLTSYPLLAVTIENYARIHLRHHRFYFTQTDPDFLRKQGPDWTFPMTRPKLLSLFLQDLSGVTFVKYVLGGKKAQMFDKKLFERKHPSPAWLKPAFFAAIALVLTLVGGWFYFLVYWVVPLVTVFPVIVRWGAICEHSYGEEGATPEETSPVILPSTLGKLFLPNLNFTMHVYHHYFPGVSFSALPEVHRIFVEEKLVRTDQLFVGHRDYLRYILTGRRALGVSNGPVPA